MACSVAVIGRDQRLGIMGGHVSTETSLRNQSPPLELRLGGAAVLDGCGTLQIVERALEHAFATIHAGDADRMSGLSGTVERLCA